MKEAWMKTWMQRRMSIAIGILVRCSMSHGERRTEDIKHRENEREREREGIT